MKLYTKQMFLIAAEKCEVSMIDAEHIMKYIDEYVTPIELPSDEEIYLEAEKYPYGGREGSKRMAFIEGAKWMRDKIQGGNK
ncbi:MAG: hypothetical protein ACRCW1_08175 [Anaerotignaceae bacterium]